MPWQHCAWVVQATWASVEESLGQVASNSWHCGLDSFSAWAICLAAGPIAMYFVLAMRHGAALSLAVVFLGSSSHAHMSCPEPCATGGCMWCNATQYACEAVCILCNAKGRLIESPSRC